MLTRLQFPNRVFWIKQRTVRRSCVVESLAPAFPGYVFVAARGCWSIIQSVIGVSGFVRQGGEVALLRSSVVEGLTGQASPEGILPESALPVSQRFKSGDQVRIYGATAAQGTTGTFQKLVDVGQAVVLIDWMGRWVPVSVDERDLERITERRVSRSNRRRKNQGKVHTAPQRHAAQECV